MLKTDKARKTTILMTAMATLIAAALIFVPFISSASTSVEAAPASVGDEFTITEDHFEGGYDDGKDSSVTIPFNNVTKTGEASGTGTVVASAFGEVNVSEVYYTGTVNLGGKLKEAAESGRLNVDIRFVGTITLTGSSAGGDELDKPYVYFDAGFDIPEGVDSDGIADNPVPETECGWDADNSAYLLNETTFDYTTEPMKITSDYTLVTGSTIKLELSPVFYLQRINNSNESITNKVSCTINGNFLFAFDFEEVVLNVSTDNIAYGKIVQGDQSELYQNYADAAVNGTASDEAQIDKYGKALSDLPSLTGDGNSQTIRYGLTDYVTFTAIPMTGFYFNRWQDGISETGKVINKGPASLIPSGTYFIYNADFNSFAPSVPSVQGQGAGYIYNPDAQQGPSLNTTALPGFEPTQYYVGNLNSGFTDGTGEKYGPSAIAPESAGSYEHRAKITRDGEVFGVSRVQFTIFRRDAGITLSSRTAELNWGSALEEVAVTPSAGVVGTFDIVRAIPGGGYEEVSPSLVSAVPEPGEYEFLYRFTPSDGSENSVDYAKDYAIGYAAFTVTVVSRFEVNAVGGRYSETPVSDSVSGGTYNYSFDVTEGDDGETLVFTLRAYKTGSEDWAFAGWRRGMFYQSVEVEEGGDGGYLVYTYVYEIKADDPDAGTLLGSSFDAIFVRRDAERLSALPYNGSTQSALNALNIAKFNLFAGNDEALGTYDINAEITFEGGQEPKNIGSHEATVKLVTEQIDGGNRTELCRITLPFNIVKGAVTVGRNAEASVGYNAATGWARSMGYNVSGMPSGASGLEYYYCYELTTDGKTSLNGVVSLPSAPTLFTVPMQYDGINISGKSAVIAFRLVAVHDTDGEYDEDTGLHIVAESEPFTAKLDNTPVEITSFGATQAVTGWQQTVDFTATISFGGSGYSLWYGLKSGDSLGGRVALEAADVRVSEGYDVSYDYTYGADDGEITATRTFTVRFNIDTSLSGKPALAVASGLSLGANVYSAILETEEVKIDAETPEFTETVSYGGDIGAGGWYRDPVTVTLTVTDAGGSMGEITVKSLVPLREGYTGITIVKDDTYSGSGARFIATVTAPDSFEYSITDGAGNIGFCRIQYNVDVMDDGDAELITYSVSGEGGEIWVSSNFNIEFTVRRREGALRTPVILRYRTTEVGGWTEYGGYTSPGDNGTVTFNFTVSMEETGQSAFYFSALAANGVSTNTISAGSVRNDSVVPTLEVYADDYAEYIGNYWTSEAVPVRVKATDALSGIPWDENTGVYGVFVEGREDVRVVKSDVENEYIVYFTDCNEYVITVRDRAGNTVSAAPITLNVDPTTEPSFEGSAVIILGGEESEYISGTWITDSSAVIEIRLSYDAVVSGSTISYFNGTQWLTIAANVFPEEGSLLDEGRVCVFEVPVSAATGTARYRFRLETGSGIRRYFPADNTDFVVNRDSTAPVFDGGTFRDANGNEVSVTESWSNVSVTWSFSVSDSGSGVDAESIVVYAVDPEDFENEAGDLEDIASIVEMLKKWDPEPQKVTDLNNGFYEFVLTEYKIYFPVMQDKAKNYGIHYIAAMIDTSRDFEVAVTPWLMEEGNELGAAVSGTPLTENQSVRFDFNVTKDGEKFTPGASGIRAEYSFDDGKTWTPASEEHTPSIASFEFAGQAIGYIRIRLMTGAGVAVEASFGDGGFYYLKDTVEVAISVAARTEDGEEYVFGNWTARTVIVTVTVTAGAYGGTLRATGIKDFEEITVPENSDVVEHTFEFADNVNGTMTFAFTSEKPDAEVREEEVTVRIDKTSPSVELTVKYGENYSKELGEEGWAYGGVEFTPEAETGASGMTKAEYSFETDADGNSINWNEITGDVFLWEDADTVTGAVREYVVRVTTGSGLTAETRITVRIDEENPSARAIVLVTEENTTALEHNDNWYHENVGVAVSDADASGLNASGTYFNYQLTLLHEGTEVTTFPRERVRVEGFAWFLLLTDEEFRDNGYSFGTWKIDYYWESGVGKITDGGTLEVKIDKNEYTFSAESSVGGVRDMLSVGENRFVVMSDGSSDSAPGVLSSGEPLYRGTDLSNITLSPVAPPTGGEESQFIYLIRSVTVNDVESVRYEYTSPLAGGTYYFTGGKVTGDMKIEVELYCAIFPVFTNLDQSVQANSGKYVPVGLSFVAGLGRIFGALQYEVTASADFNPYDPYGIYTVTAKMTGDYAGDFPLIARDESGNITDGSAAELRVRYFENAGTEEEEYLVGTLYDFMMIDRYLDPSDKGASAFGYYGDGTRYFRQTADIFFDNSFTGLIRAFDGVYDGDGYRFSAEEIEVPASSFKAIFSSVKGGRILNLKAEIFRYEISAGGSFAVVAGTVTDNAALLDMYIAANVYIDGAEVSFGGAAAEVKSSTIVNSFAAVNIFIDGAYGSVGGFAGKFSDALFRRCVSLSQAVAENVPEGNALYAGAMAGYADGESELVTSEDSCFLGYSVVDSSLSYGISEKGSGIGNDFKYEAGLKLVARENIDDLLAGTEGWEIHSGNSAGALVNYYTGWLADRFDAKGSGVENDPFEIALAKQLELVKLAPWAYFGQTADIAPGSDAEFLSATPFRGSYDGAGYALKNVNIVGTGSVLGLFGILDGTIKNIYITDIYADFNLEEGGYAGAVVGIITERGRISGLTVSGSATVDAAGTLYAGGIAGRADGVIDNVVSSLTMRIIAENAIAGGILGSLSGTMKFVALTGGFEAAYSARANFGAVAGEFVGTAGAVSDVGFVPGISKAGGRTVTLPFVGEAGEKATAAVDYDDMLVSDEYSSGEYKTTVAERLDKAYPFSGGSGSDEDPFLVGSYREFKNIAAYPGAQFRLTADFTLGDLDGDGVPDEEFLTLGIDFSGSVDGGNKVISGVGKPLFESVSGSVRKLNLVLAVSESGSTEFGAVARRLSQGANIIRVTVTGTVEIRGDASSEIVFGGIAACSEGATIGGADFGADVVIRGGTVIYGGIAGIGDAPNGDHAKTWNVQSVSRADIGGVSLSAGKYIGIMRGGASVTFTASSAELKLNNAVSEMNVGKTISG